LKIKIFAHTTLICAFFQFGHVINAGVYTI